LSSTGRHRRSNVRPSTLAIMWQIRSGFMSGLPSLALGTRIIGGHQMLVRRVLAANGLNYSASRPPENAAKLRPSAPLFFIDRKNSPRAPFSGSAGPAATSSSVDGVWLAEFSPIADPGLVPVTVAAAIGLMVRQPDALQRRFVELALDLCRAGSAG